MTAAAAVVAIEQEAAEIADVVAVAIGSEAMRQHAEADAEVAHDD